MNSLNTPKCLENLQKVHPLVLVITNQVTINECANGLLAVGASPVMTDDLNDARELAALAAATVLNIGTINARRLDIMLAAGQAAKKLGRPVLMDPVGVGATTIRRDAGCRLINEVAPDIIRGNISEIKALAGLTTDQRGVDSASADADSPEAIALVAEKLALSARAVVAVTGEVDVVSNGRDTYFIEGGSPWMTQLTGTGCMLSAISGGYAAANPGDLTSAVVAALSHMALAGEQSEKGVNGVKVLGSFRTLLFDRLGLIEPRDLLNFQGVKKQ